MIPICFNDVKRGVFIGIKTWRCHKVVWGRFGVAKNLIVLIWTLVRRTIFWCDAPLVAEAFGATSWVLVRRTWALDLCQCDALKGGATHLTCFV